MSNSRHALVVGKFYPPHEGHHQLIDLAEKECQFVTVAICWSKWENINPHDRQAWIEDRHPNVQTVLVHDDSPVLYTEETWGLFLDSLVDALGWISNGWPNIVYSGEDYAPEFAKRLQARYALREKGLFWAEMVPPVVHSRMVDRSKFPVSATQFRSDPTQSWDLLAPATAAGLCKRVVVCGAESSGTTTLAKDLADWFDTTVVPEYGRHFDWAVGRNHAWKREDFLHIAEQQKTWEDYLARTARNGLLICDTDEFATAMFERVYLGNDENDKELMEFARLSRADAYIITSHRGVPFEDDGTRMNSGKRDWMTKWLSFNLPGPPIITVDGSKTERLDTAVRFINNEVLKWDIEPPLEQRPENHA